MNPRILATAKMQRTRVRLMLVSFGLLYLLFCDPSSAVAEKNNAAIEVLPAEIDLAGPEARQRFIVHAVIDSQRRAPVESGLSIRIANPDICRVSGNKVIPLSDGDTELIVTRDEVQIRVPVRVRGVAEAYPWSFRHDVLPVLAKVGCNSGACHGALAGKGGFRLSLRGYDPDADHHTITRQSRGRRIEMADPGRSLLLAKPSGAIPHKGGVRFDVDSDEYRILAEWIRSGAPAPDDNDADIVRLNVMPATAMLQVGDQQQLIVTATFSDGSTRDVTPWVKWTSADETVAVVDDEGRVEVIGHGEGALTAWYSSKIAMARVTSPFDNDVDEQQFESAPRRNFIDELGLNQLRRLKLPPAPRCSDEEFVRRVYLDCIGTLPTAEEVVAFLTDDRSDKRDRLIEDLLHRPEFVDYWTYKWSDVLLINGNLLRPNSVKAYYQWIRSNVESNTPWDDLVTGLLVAQGDTHQNGATNFYALHQDPEAMSENAAQAFLGLSIGCAKCHDHPLEKWTNDQYYAMASLFARVRGKGWGGDSRNGDGLRTVYVVSKGELIQPRTGIPQPPTPLDGEPLPFDSADDRRVHLAKWMVSPENPYFARSIANRVWANFFGVGLVDPVDDMRVSNPASNEALLQATADYLVSHDFDLKELMRAIMQSETYQRSSVANESNENDFRFYSRYYPRRLMAEVLLDAISQVTDVPSSFTEVVFSGADKRKTDFYPTGTRAIQLYDSAVQSYFLKTFGRNQREITCECERSNEPSMVQVLHLSNGATINEKLAAAGNQIQRMLDGELSNQQIIDQLYLSALSRYPTENEIKSLGELLQDTTVNRRILVEDLFWSVMSSREFLFNH